MIGGAGGESRVKVVLVLMVEVMSKYCKHYTAGKTLRNQKKEFWLGQFQVLSLAHTPYANASDYRGLP